MEALSIIGRISPIIILVLEGWQAADLVPKSTLGHALHDAPNPLKGAFQTLGFAQTHWGNLPQTPFKKHPQPPHFLRGLPRR